MQQYVDNIIAKSGRVAEVYNKSTLNDVSIENVDSLNQLSLRHYCATQPQA